MPKNSQESAPQIENLEANPFEQQERGIVEGITEKHIEATKIDLKTLKEVDGFLSKDSENLYREFALKWFNNFENQQKMKEEGKVVPPDASDEWKISMALKSKEQGGMGAFADLTKEKYKNYREEMDKIGVLRTDIKKGQIPPETPFLLLNYLQASVDLKKEEARKIRAEKNPDSELMAAAKEKEIESIYSSMKDLASKTMNEDLISMAEKKVSASNFPAKEKFITDNLESSKREMEEKRNNELMEKEWKEYIQLPEKQRKKYQKKYECILETKPVLGQTEEAFQEMNKYTFKIGMEKMAKRNGADGPAFYAMLEKGYKPHQAQFKRHFLNPFKPAELLIPKSNGSTEQILLGRDATHESVFKDFSFFNKKFGEDYLKKIDLQTKKELDLGWEASHEQKIKEAIEYRIRELAESSSFAEGGIERVYQIAKEKIIQNYIKNRTEVAPKTEKEKKKIKNDFAGNSQEINIGSFVKDSYNKIGGLEKLVPGSQDYQEIISNYLKEKCGMDLGPVVSQITPEQYEEALQKKSGLFRLLMETIEMAMNIISSSKPKSRKKS